MCSNEGLGHAFMYADWLRLATVDVRPGCNQACPSVVLWERFHTGSNRAAACLHLLINFPFIFASLDALLREELDTRRGTTYMRSHRRKESVRTIVCDLWKRNEWRISETETESLREFLFSSWMSRISLIIHRHCAFQYYIYTHLSVNLKKILNTLLSFHFQSWQMSQSPKISTCILRNTSLQSDAVE